MLILGKTATSDGKFREDFAKKRNEQIKRATEPQVSGRVLIFDSK